MSCARLSLRCVRYADTSGVSRGLAAPVQYGNRINAVVLYLLYYRLLPEKRLSEVMDDLLGVHLVTATIARFSQDRTQRFVTLRWRPPCVASV